jgi:hypothetical protein
MTYDRIKSCYHFVEGECPHQRFLRLVKTWEMDGAATKERIAKFWLWQIDKTQKSLLARNLL